MIKWTTLITLLLIVLTSCGDRKTEKSTQSKAATSEPVVKSSKKKILFFGNSITAGYQLDLEDAFPAVIQKRLDSLGYEYEVINAGLSGETTASGASRIEWVLQTIPDIFVLELGANDGLRGLPLEQSQKNLQIIIDEVKRVNPMVEIIICGMEVPPNLGEQYTGAFRTIFPKVAEKNHAVLIPFLLEGVAGETELNLGDGIHPTSEGHAIVAETVWKYLAPLLTKHS
ncbi:MAG: arylesterase [Cyclobacteriaceae bacterium]